MVAKDNRGDTGYDAEILQPSPFWFEPKIKKVPKQILFTKCFFPVIF